MTNFALKAPGVYVRPLETETGPASRTALTAFVGVAERGPLDEPQFLRSFGDFELVFGSIWSYGSLGPSVYAFFLNGGEEACVVRVARPALPAAGSGACSAVENVATAKATGQVRDADGFETLRLSASSPGSWANRLRASVLADAQRDMELTALSTTAASGATAIVVDATYDFAIGAKLKLTNRSNPLQKSLHEVTGINPAQRRLDIDPALPRAYPKGSSVSGRGFRLELQDGMRREVFDGLSVNPLHPRHFVGEINGPSGRQQLGLRRDGHSLLVRAEQVPGPGGLPNSKPASTQLAFSGGGDGITNATGTLDSAVPGPSLDLTARVNGGAGNDIVVRAAPFTGKLALPVPAAPGGARNRLVLEGIEGWIAGDTVTVKHAADSTLTPETALIDEVDGDAHALTLNVSLANDYPRGSECSIAKRFNLSVESADGKQRELFVNLDVDAGPRLVTTIIDDAPTGERKSKLVCVTVASSAKPPVGSVVLSGGTDADEVPITHYTGYQADGTPFQAGSSDRVGLATLESVPEVSLVCLPDIGVRNKLDPEDRALAVSQALMHCQKMGERFALLDVPAELAPDQALEYAARFTDGGAGRFGALYFPCLSFPIEGKTWLLSPSAAVAGLIARADRQDGVGRAPANLRLKGASAAAHDVDAAVQAELNVAGVNCIRKFTVGALNLWGARTLSADPEHLYVHNRRVVLLTVKTLSSGLRWAVFEPNDQKLRQRIRDSIDGFLRSMLARGLTAGQRPEDAFYVKVDEALNGPETESQVLAEIGIALSKPAEFVVISVKRSPDTLTLVEEEA